MKIVKLIGKGLSFVGVFLLICIITLYASLLLICYGPSTKARNLFVTTFLETGALKFMVKLVMSDKKVQEVVDSNSLKAMDASVDTDLINVSNDKKDIEVVEISGSNYKAKLIKNDFLFYYFPHTPLNSIHSANPFKLIFGF